MNKPSNKRVTRFVVFSFDDGLIDFKNNALPILDLYGFKASINIISGFSDKSIAPHYRCLTIDDIKLLYFRGHEIANHTNSHKKHGSYEELDICNNKINNWCNHDKIVGVVMPKYAKPSKSSYKYIKKKKPPYFTYEPRHFFSFSSFFEVIKYNIFQRNNNQLKRLSHEVKLKEYKKGKSKKIYRIEVRNTIKPKDIFDSLQVIRNNYCITLCFHSITNKNDDNPYPKGTWSIEQFSEFCKMINEDDSFVVVTQEVASCVK